MKLLKIAWRNLWRNRRRTAITSASILFAVFFAVIMRAYQLGFYDHMIKNAIESYSGFLQIQQADYQDDPSLENTFSLNERTIESIGKTDGVKAVVPRIQTFALASSGNQTKGSLIIGIDPEKEKSLSNPENLLIRFKITPKEYDALMDNDQIPLAVKNKLKDCVNKSYTNTGTIAMDLGLDKKKEQSIIELIAKKTVFPGKYLSAEDDGVLVSEKLAQYLNLHVGDTLILFGQGYHGATAADLFPVRGFIQMANPELNNKLVYTSLSKARYFASLGNNISTISINLDDNSDKNLVKMKSTITSMLNSNNLVIRDWKEFDKVMWQQIQGDNQSGKAFLALLYFIIFFGIFGTVLMMIHERYRELGVMVAIGMQKIKLAVILVYEMIFIGIIGVLTGSALSLPLIFYYYYNPYQLTGDMAQTMENMGFEAVMPLAFPDMYMVWQSIIVALMVVLSSIYPITKVLRLKEIQALRA